MTHFRDSLLETGEFQKGVMWKVIKVGCLSTMRLAFEKKRERWEKGDSLEQWNSCRTLNVVYHFQREIQ
jgi:hypothetical protein